MTRYRAVGLANGGLTQVQVAKELKIEPRTLKCWGKTLENRKSRGRKTAVSRGTKIVVTKSALKPHQSTGKLAQIPPAKQHPVSNSVMHLYLRPACN